MKKTALLNIKPCHNLDRGRKISVSRAFGSFPPPFREVVVNPSKAGDLAD